MFKDATSTVVLSVMIILMLIMLVAIAKIKAGNRKLENEIKTKKALREMTGASRSLNENHGQT